MILIFCFCIYFHTSKGAEYCEVRSYDEKDANRIQYAVMHHLTRSDKQEIYRGLIQGLNKQQSTAEASIETVISGFDSLGITTVELNHTYIPDDNGINVKIETPIESAKYKSVSKTLHSRAYSTWTEEEEQQLLHEYEEGLSINAMSIRHGRSEGAIKSRLEKKSLFL